MDSVMVNGSTQSRARTILTWVLIIGIGVWGIYLGFNAYTNSMARTLEAIEVGELRTGLTGGVLSFVQSLRSALVYAAIAWVVIMVWDLVPVPRVLETQAAQPQALVKHAVAVKMDHVIGLAALLGRL